MKYFVIFFLPLLLMLFISCDDIYKAGNGVKLLSVEINTNVNQNQAFLYLDSSDALLKYQLPKKYDANLKNGGDLEYFPESNKVIYFNDPPEEAYHLSSNGVFNIQQVFNPRTNGVNWISNASQLTVLDYDRIEKRIDNFLNEIIMVERNSNVPDSLIFWRKPYDTIICKLER